MVEWWWSCGCVADMCETAPPEEQEQLLVADMSDTALWGVVWGMGHCMGRVQKKFKCLPSKFSKN